jgi:hypothetical protein
MRVAPHAANSMRRKRVIVNLQGVAAPEGLPPRHS